MSVLDLIRPELRAMSGYSSARMESGSAGVLLNANESPWPQDPSRPLHRYPDPQPSALREQMAGLYGVRAAQLLIGRGSDEPIDLLVRAFCRAGRDAILVQSPTFGMYAVAAAVQDCAVLDAPLALDRPQHFDVDGVLRSVTPATRLVFVCSPNNPTGGLVSRADVLRLAVALAGRALVVLDEAYIEFADRPSLAGDVATTPNLAVLRTLSKAHALAGARIGALIAAPAIIDVLRRITAPYPLPTPCVDAALAALEPGSLRATAGRLALIKVERDRVARAFAEIDCVREVLPSQANFLCVRFVDAGAALSRLGNAGLIVRDLRRHGALGDALRISIGLREENDRVIAALADQTVRGSTNSPSKSSAAFESFATNGSGAGPA